MQKNDRFHQMVHLKHTRQKRHRKLYRDGIKRDHTQVASKEKNDAPAIPWSIATGLKDLIQMSKITRPHDKTRQKVI